MKFDNISISKGIAIILMVVVHSRFSEYGSDFINMYHMPLIFFFSGYCFKEGYLFDFKTFAKKRIKGIYYPYVKWGLVFLLLHNVFFYLNIYNSEFGFRGTVSYLYGYNDFLKRGIDIVISLSSAEQLLGGYWFLHSLFWGSFVFFLTVKIIKNRWVGGAFLLIATFLLLFLNLHIPVFGIGAREFLGAFFMVIGSAYRYSNYKIENRYWIIPLSALILIISTRHWQCGMLSLTWQKVLPYSFSALAGTIMVFVFSNVIMKSKVGLKTFVYIGDHTLDILTWHFLSFKLVSLVIIWIYKMPIEMLAEFPVIEDYAYKGWWMAYCLVGIGMPLVFVTNLDRLISRLRTCI